MSRTNEAEANLEARELKTLSVFQQMKETEYEDTATFYRNKTAKGSGPRSKSDKNLEETQQGYGVSMIMLAYLRCMASGKPFRMASNLGATGRFESIIIEQQGHYKCVEVAHKNKPVIFDDLLERDGRFSILDFFITYRDEVLCSLGENCEIILYTNAEVHGHTLKYGRDQDFLTSSDAGVSFFYGKNVQEVYELRRYVEQYNTFLSDLYQESRDISQYDLVKLIHKKVAGFVDINCIPHIGRMIASLKRNSMRKDIKSLLTEVEILGDFSKYESFLRTFKICSEQASEGRLHELIELELRKFTGFQAVNELMSKLEERIRQWLRLENPYFLSGQDWFWLDTIKEIFLRLSEDKIREMTTLDMKVTSKIIKDLKQHISNASVLHLLVDGDCTILATCKVHQALMDELDTWPIFTNLKPSDMDCVLQAWRNRWGYILVLEINNVAGDFLEVMKRIANTLKRHPEKKLIVISDMNDLTTTNQILTLKGKQKFIQICTKTTMLHLVMSTQEKLLAKEVNFQGFRVPLGILLKDIQDSKEVIEDELLMKIMLDQEIVIGEELPRQSDCYIPRKLKECGHTISGNTRQNHKDRVVVLSGPRGMGQSTHLTYLARQMKLKKPSYWVIPVDLKNHASYLHQLNLDRSIKRSDSLRHEHILNIIKTVAKISESKHSKFVQYFLNFSWYVTGNIIVFLDGYEGISQNNVDLIQCVLNDLLSTRIRKIFISSRPLSQKIIEETIHCLKFDLVPFTKEEQQEFLVTYFATKLDIVRSERLETFSRKMLGRVSDACGDTDNVIPGNPLHSMIIADIFEGSLRKENGTDYDDLSDQLDAVSFLRDFFNKTCEMNFRDKDKNDRTVEYGKFKEEEQVFHQYCALFALLPPSDVLRLHDRTVVVGDLNERVQRSKAIISVISSVEDGRPAFIHKIFAEYFMAYWFSENYNHNKVITEEVLLQPHFRTVSLLFNQIVSETLKLHTAVISGDSASFPQLVKTTDVNEKDRGGRTALHLAAGFVDDESFTEVLLQHGADVTVQDDVLQWSALRYADANQKWDAIDLLLGSSGNSADLVCTTDHLRNEEFAQKILKHACKRGQNHILKFLLDHDVSVNFLLDAQLSSSIQADSRATATRQLLLHDTLDKLLKSGSDINAKFHNGNTILHNLSERGIFITIMYLLERNPLESELEKRSGSERMLTVLKGGSDTMMKQKVMTQIRNDDGKTAQELAAASGMDMVATYLQHTRLGLDSFLTDYKHPVQNPMVLCVVRFLVENRSADVNYRDEDGETSLHHAVRRGDAEVVEYLMKVGADVAAHGNCGRSPLHLAAMNGELDIVKCMIEQGGASPDAVSDEDGTPLFMATRGGHLSTVRYLIGKGADMDILNKYGLGPLHAASVCSKMDVLEYYLEECHCDVDIVTSDKCTALYLSCGVGLLDVVLYLISKGAQKDTRDKNGYTLLHVAAKNNRANVVQYLHEVCKCPIDSPSLANTTPLHLSCMAGHLECTEYLVRMGAKTDAENKSGFTPLHVSSLCGKLNVVKYLIEKADCTPNIATAEGVTPLHLASKNGCLQIVQYLITNGAMVGAVTCDGYSPLHVSAYKGKLAVTKYFVDKCGSDLNSQSFENWTPLHSACKAGHLRVAQYLISKGANTESFTSFGLTPLHVSTIYGHLKLIEYLIKECKCDPIVLEHTTSFSITF